ncbi:hypothetical protein [Peterkaempfera sp. SMS 1(5)a]|uniref:hypothetical protein n=1 Tax=Peterkaempfera podocarpi TaxID=3232308 RepID=UPI0036709894
MGVLCTCVLRGPGGSHGAVSGWLTDLQPAVLSDPSGAEQWLMVGAGTKVRDFYEGLEEWFPGRRLVPPTLGGAGGQLLAGVVNTGTHGGDVARGPISAYVRAMILVGSGGAVRILQQPGLSVVDTDLLRTLLQSQVDTDVPVTVETSADAFDAALVSVGRFGVVYAYVFAVHDETEMSVVEHRTARTWTQVKQDLAFGTLVQDARAGDEFLQVVINPVPENGDHRCFQTRHKLLPDSALTQAGDAFGLGPDVPAAPVQVVRSASPLPEILGQVFAADYVTPELEDIRLGLVGLGTFFTIRFFPLGAILGAAFFEAAACLGRIGPDYRIGDAMADVINIATDAGVPAIVEQVTSGVLGSAQSDRLPDGSGPWLVYGSRPRVADFFDYDHNYYRGDSVEVFFPADTHLPDKVDGLIAVFDQLRSAGRPIGAYISLRFFAASTSLLATTPADPTCAVEISMLRGLEGNTQALGLIQDATVAMGGFVHWGQQNDLDANTVRAQFGDRLVRWLTALWNLEGASRTFSTPFTRQHGLELRASDEWTSWQPTGMVTLSSPGVVPAAGGPLEVFAVDSDLHVVRSIRAATPATPWAAIRPEQVAEGATPVAVRGHSGRVEVFARADDRLKHSYEDGRPGGPFTSWDTKGAGLLNPGPRITGDPAVALHADGRLEAFARDFEVSDSRVRHTWAMWLDGPWSGFDPMGAQKITGVPAACLRRHLEGASVTDQLVLTTAAQDGTVMWAAQNGPAGDTAWGPWQPLHGPSGQTATVRSSPLAVTPTGPGMAVHVLGIDALGQVHEAIDADHTVAVTWNDWRALPTLPGIDRLDATSRLLATQPQHLWLFGVSVRGYIMAIEFVPAPGGSPGPIWEGRSPVTSQPASTMTEQSRSSPGGPPTTSSWPAVRVHPTAGSARPPSRPSPRKDA